MKTVIITGASRGIGAATARLAAKAGYAVAVNFRRNQSAALSVVEEIKSRGGTAEAIGAEISTEKGVLHLFAETARLLPGQLMGLVNNAGILETQMRLEDMDVARLERIFTANITGQFLCAREAVKAMSTHRGGSGGAIVNVSSLAAKTGAPNEYLDYAASKAALDALTIGLSKEVAAEGIRVKDHQRKGIANLLYQALEARAAQKHIPTLIADVSKSARPFFEKQGFSSVKPSKIIYRDKSLKITTCKNP